MAETRTTASLPAHGEAAEDRWRLLEHAFGRSLGRLSAERAAAASALLERWRGRRFHALILGEFKRGKSTLLNALVGEDLLPTGVQPVTTVPTRVRSGPARRAAVRLRDGGEREIAMEDVREYADESRNPGNSRGAVSVEIELPARLPPGVVLVDVPGLGSVHRHNTEAAQAALPDADAALVVASVDPPIGDAEIRLLRTLRRHAARVDVVLNKIDYLDPEGRRAAEDFTRRALADAGFPDVALWPVSARDGLRARESGDERAWRRSGMHDLAEALDRFFEQERVAVLGRSLAGKLERLVEQESALLDVRRAAAEQSIEKLRDVIGAFRRRRAMADREASEAVLIFRRRFDAMFAGCSERAAAAWREPSETLATRLRELQAEGRHQSRRDASHAMHSAAANAVSAFIGSFLPEEAARLAEAYASLAAEVGRASAERAEGVWRLAAELIPFEPPRTDPPPAPPAPRPGGLQLGSPHLLLDDLLGAGARLLTRRAALRRLAAEARDEADSRYGQAVEQSREAFGRAYDEHFRALLAAYEQSATQVARAVEAALATAEERAQALEADRRADACVEAARAELGELRAVLRRLARENPRFETDPRTSGGPA